MLLRAGSEIKGDSVTVAGITDDGHGVGVVEEDLLNAFIEAVLADDPQILDMIQHKLYDTLGAAVVVDVAAVIANFMQMVRIADATGTPLDDAFVEASASVRTELGIDLIPSAKNTPGIGIDDRDIEN